MFAVEIVENIIKYCDGKTLLNCLDVDDVFRSRVYYLSKTLNIFKKRCKDEIPFNELIDYTAKRSLRDLQKHETWMQIYEKWVQWQDIKSNVHFAFYKCPVDIPRITCISSIGRFIAIGSEDGRVRIFNSHWEIISLHRFCSAKVTDILYLLGTNRNNNEEPVILVAYNNVIFISHAININEPFLTYQDILSYSAYRQYVCAVKRGGRVTVDKIVYPFQSGKSEIKHARIYSQNEVRTCDIWNGVCTFLVHTEVKKMNYDDDSYEQGILTGYKTTLDFHRNNLQDIKNSYILHGEVVITLTEDISYIEVMEVFKLDEKKPMHKTFHSGKILGSKITYIYLYGNTLLIGDNTGVVYFYEIKSWEEFDINNYSKMIFLGPHPIIYIDSVECDDKLTFYVATSFKVHVVQCFSSSKVNLLL